ncbi:hypothetical protein [Candidatus Clostridium stratigraminis]|uniref:Uncharacterized protein n=1 Tax=Candidatus Clostridium stratigraminis TaxID=3381661 RepID=A0ABW8T6L4_9CLOT
MIYIYLTNKIVLLRKQVMLLANQNDELKNKLNKLILEQKLERQKKYSDNNLLEENPVTKDLDEEI